MPHRTWLAPPPGTTRRRIEWKVLLAAVLAMGAPLGCTGQIETGHGNNPRNPSGAGGGGFVIDPNCNDPSCFGTEAPVAGTAVPRLSHRQWENTVKDLLRLDAPSGLSSSFTADPPGTTEFDTDTRVLEVTPGLWGDYQRAAEILAERVSTDAAALARILPEDAPGNARAFIEEFGRRAFRRPLTSAEIARYEALFADGAEHYPAMDSFAAGARLVLEAMLQSPNFVYRQEIGRVNGDVVELTDFELATRLSYALWDTMPDDALLEAAAQGKLSTPDGIAMEAARMLDDPRAEALVASFHEQLLELDAYDRIERDGLPPGALLREETERFLHEVIFEEEGSVRDLYTATYGFVNEQTAPLYGVEASGSGMVKVDFDPEQRSGLLTHAGFLASRAGDTAPILRGVFINLRLICTDLPTPVQFEPPTPTGTTRRERIDSITGPGTCGQTCHAKVINPIGFALESFDDLGRYRTEDNGKPVDTYAEFSFYEEVVSFDGPVELSHMIAERREAHECYVRNWLEFLYGRPHEDEDMPIIMRVAHASRTSNLPIKQILVELVRSPSFRTRLAPEASR